MMGPPDLAHTVFFTSGWANTAPFPGVAELNAEHMQLYGRPADPITGNGYAAIQVLVDAIERAGTLDSEDIRDALAATENLMTVNGPITFDATGAPVEGTIFTPGLQWQEGEMVLVWPREHGGYDVPEQPYYFHVPWDER